MPRGTRRARNPPPPFRLPIRSRGCRLAGRVTARPHSTERLAIASCDSSPVRATAALCRRGPSPLLDRKWIFGSRLCPSGSSSCFPDSVHPTSRNSNRRLAPEQLTRRIPLVNNRQRAPPRRLDFPGKPPGRPACPGEDSLFGTPANLPLASPNGQHTMPKFARFPVQPAGCRCLTDRLPPAVPSLPEPCGCRAGRSSRRG